MPTDDTLDGGSGDLVADQGLLAHQRRALIMEAIRRDGAVRVSELVEQLGVSDMTVRRDLDALARSGDVEKVHGGAVGLVGRTGDEVGFAAKSGLEPSAKRAIAEAAALLVTPGSVVALGGGTTVHAVATRLVNIPGLTVVTNSLPIAQLLESEGVKSPTSPSVLLTGGAPTPSQVLVGPLADMVIGSLHVDLLILGTHGASGRAGLTTPNLAEAQTNRALIGCARRVAVVADHTKWGVTGLSSFAGLHEVDYFVTDAGLTAEDRSALAEVVGELVIAEASDASGTDALPG
ncbi:DeoR/GlpR family DNA-binding transcription regulator [Kitasatospora herbaricolor]|uniref:DeoR/GlpR family DNA-binding transcription regulator n=1 Tax=Kitasatospora herbaricolor TaxID=68217 RepID=UPI00093AA3E6|nr:DeoR family transcriptional regulator [Streptomyces sp. CB03911]